MSTHARSARIMLCKGSKTQVKGSVFMQGTCASAPTALRYNAAFTHGHIMSGSCVISGQASPVCTLGLCPWLRYPIDQTRHSIGPFHWSTAIVVHDLEMMGRKGMAFVYLHTIDLTLPWFVMSPESCEKWLWWVKLWHRDLIRAGGMLGFDICSKQLFVQAGWPKWELQRLFVASSPNHAHPDSCDFPLLLLRAFSCLRYRSLEPRCRPCVVALRTSMVSSILFTVHWPRKHVWVNIVRGHGRHHPGGRGKGLDTPC